MFDDSSFEWDAFVSHASEDKAPFVVALVDELQKHGLRVWFDSFTLKIGDSLRESIDRGLAKSKFGIVVLSPSFFAKNWPQKELNALFSREVQGNKVILPIWHGVTKEDVLRYSPLLSDLVACNTAHGIPAVVRSLIQVIRPEALELETSIKDAQQAASRVKEQLKDVNPHLEPRFSWTTSTADDQPGPSPQGLVASVAKEGFKIDYITRNPEAYNKEPISFNLSVTREARKLMEEALRSGHRLKLGAEEVKGVSPEFFLQFGFRPEMFTEVRSLELRPSNNAIPKKFRLRLNFEHGSEHEQFPFVEFDTVRVGTQEVEIRSSTASIVMSLTITMHFDGTPNNLQVRLLLEGQEIKKIYKSQHALQLLFAGGHLELFDLERDNVLARFGGVQPPPKRNEDQFLEWFVTTLHDIVCTFNESLIWNSWPTEQDAFNLAHLHKAVSTGNVSVPVDEITLPLSHAQFAAVQPILAQNGLLTLKQIDPPEFATVLGKTFAVGECQIFLMPSGYSVTEPVDPEGVMLVKIWTTEPIVFVFDNFSKSATTAETSNS
jgi:hypothetical protein